MSDEDGRFTGPTREDQLALDIEKFGVPEHMLGLQSKKNVDTVLNNIGASVRPLTCSICGADVKRVGCDHVFYQEDEHGNSFMYDRSPAYWFSRDEEE